MAQVIGVRFKDVGKIYYFDPLDLEIVKGSRVIVETARGVECGEVAMERKEVSDEGLVQPLKPVIRVATKEDLKKVEENHSDTFRMEVSFFGFLEHFAEGMAFRSGKRIFHMVICTS